MLSGGGGRDELGGVGNMFFSTLSTHPSHGCKSNQGLLPDLSRGINSTLDYMSQLLVFFGPLTFTWALRIVFFLLDVLYSALRKGCLNIFVDGLAYL